MSRARRDSRVRWSPAGAVLALSLLLLLVAGRASASAARTADILPLYNGDRIANGLPPAPMANPQMEFGCANHLHYMALNGMVHGEDPSKPGYTPEGNYQNGAAGGEALAATPGWSASYEPWQTAPIHLYILFDPSVFQVGYADGDGYVCMRVRGNDALNSETQPPSSPTFYAWTGDSGRENVPYAEHAAEYPYTPQQLVGIPATQTTGPNILLFSAGDQGVPISAAMTGPDGPVQVALVNRQTRNSVGDGGWFLGGGVLIPIKPLRPLSTYNVTVNWDDGGARQQTFSFTTSHPIKANMLSLRPHSDLRGRTYFAVRSSAPGAILTLTGPRKQTVRPAVRHGRTAWLSLRHGLWQACASSGGPPGYFQFASSCVQLMVQRPAAVQ